MRIVKTHRPQEDAHKRLTQTGIRYFFLNYSERLLRIFPLRLIHDYGYAASACHGGRAGGSRCLKVFRQYFECQYEGRQAFS